MMTDADQSLELRLAGRRDQQPRMRQVSVYVKKFPSSPQSRSGTDSLTVATRAARKLRVDRKSTLSFERKKSDCSSRRFRDIRGSTCFAG